MAETAPIVFWKPLDDLVVQLHVAGVRNKAIAEMFGYRPQRVWQILHDPRGVELIALRKRELLTEVDEDIRTKIIVLAHQSLNNLKSTVETKCEPTSGFKRHQDAVGFKLLAMAGYGPESADLPVGDESPISREQAASMIDLLKRREQVREVEDAVYEVVPTGARVSDEDAPK